jgi:lipoprotein NlpI
MRGVIRYPFVEAMSLMATLFAGVAAADDLDTCAKASGDTAIAACSRAIELKTHDLAALFYHRGHEYKTKGDLDHAIADYSEAIRLDPKDADAYNNRGNVYLDKGDLDRAMADYTEAIGLDPKYAVAYYNRGIMYRKKGDLDRAMADYTEAIRLDPKYAHAYGSRGIVYRDKGDLDRAIADSTEAIRLDPKDASAFRVRGLANFYAGALPKAFADLDQASALDPKEAYAALWLDIVGDRSQVVSRLPQAIAQIDMTKWPAPVIRLFLGQTTPAAVLAAADDPNPTTKQGQVCEANFYSGALSLRQGAKDEALRLLQLAAGDCPRDFDEWFAAKAELKALGAAP